MEKTLLVVERIVLESLEKNEKSILELEADTSLDRRLLKSIIHELICRGIVKSNQELFSLNWESKEKWLPVVKDREGFKAEIKELFSTLVNQVFLEEKLGTLKMQKIWLDRGEKEELDRKFKDLQSFVGRVQQRRKTNPVNEKIYEREVLFYGSSSYQNLLNGMLFS